MNKYLTGQCSEEEIIEVNAWMKESEENARQLFRMEEIYHLGKFDRYADEQRIAHAEKLLYKKLDEAKGKQAKLLRMHRCMLPLLPSFFLWEAEPGTGSIITGQISN